MKKSMTMLTIAATTTALVAGCAAPQTTGQGVGAGAGIGALVGAGLGQAIGRDTRSTLIGAAAGAALGAGVGYVWSQQMQQQKVAMEQATQGTSVQVSQTADNRLRINIPADASFAVGSAVLSHNMYPILDRLAQTLQQNPYTDVSIIGHTDSTGSNAINYTAYKKLPYRPEDFVALTDMISFANVLVGFIRGGQQFSATAKNAAFLDRQRAIGEGTLQMAVLLDGDAVAMTLPLHLAVNY